MKGGLKSEKNIEESKRGDEMIVRPYLESFREFSQTSTRARSFRRV